MKSKDGFPYVKVVFEPGETGWAALIEPNRVRIDNIPYSDRLNLHDDVAEIAPIEGRQIQGVTRVLKRLLAKKIAVSYPAPHGDNFKAICLACEKQGIHCEGILGGLMVMAFNGDLDPIQIAAEAGVTATLHPSQPDLQPIG